MKHVTNATLLAAQARDAFLISAAKLAVGAVGLSLLLSVFSLAG